MKNFTTQFTKAILLLFLSVSVFSCSEEEVLPETSMEFTVVNELGNPVEGAKVEVYSDFEGYVQDDQSKLIGSGTTSTDGKVSVTGGLEAKKYFFSITEVSTAIKTNWEGANTTESVIEANKINTTSVVIKETATAYLAGKKSWMIHQVFYNSVDVTSEFDKCWLDNVITYYKDKTVIFDEGSTKCSSVDPQAYAGVFDVINDVLITNDEVDGEEASTILELTTKSMTLAQQDAEGNIIELVLKVK
jgi:hypothetical protein